MKHVQLFDRLDLEQQVSAPADVRRQRREQVDDGEGGGHGRHDQRQRFRAAEPAQRQRRPVQAEPPRGGIAPVPRDVSPILCDQPDASGDGQKRRQGVVDEPERKAEREHDEDQRAEMPFVPAHPDEVDPRPERMPLDCRPQPVPGSSHHPMFVCGHRLPHGAVSAESSNTSSPGTRQSRIR